MGFPYRPRESRSQHFISDNCTGHDAALLLRTRRRRNGRIVIKTDCTKRSTTYVPESIMNGHRFCRSRHHGVGVKWLRSQANDVGGAHDRTNANHAPVYRSTLSHTNQCIRINIIRHVVAK